MLPRKKPIQFEAALARKQRERPSREPLLDGDKQARLVQIACSEPPPGRARWTLRMLSERLVELEIVESISPPTVMRALKKPYFSRTDAPVG